MPADTTMWATSASWVSISMARSGTRSPLAARLTGSPRWAKSSAHRCRSTSGRTIARLLEVYVRERQTMRALRRYRSPDRHRPFQERVMRRIIHRRELVRMMRATTTGCGSGPVAVQPAGQFIAARSSAAAGDAATAVLIGPGDESRDDRPDLPHCSSSWWNSPKSAKAAASGPGPSVAPAPRLPGELRARGALKRDQLVFPGALWFR